MNSCFFIVNVPYFDIQAIIEPTIKASFFHALEAVFLESRELIVVLLIFVWR
jgi:hypothetical protein